jgi:hypothetical protein
MKATKKRTRHQIDKRDLVNLDLYKNEIDIMHSKLSPLKTKGLSEDEKRTVNQLEEELNGEKCKLDEFYDYCDGWEKQPNGSRKNSARIDAEKIDNFFLHLKSFENDFRDIRDKINEFVDSI